ncbi:MAG TPA: IS630 family transposase [Geminicoccaceae bacterium]|nr:IS630 family transposase [Geminicoccaceae bacterium]
MAEVDPRRLVFLDESGLDTRLTRTHARAAKGKRAPGAVPCDHWKRLTVIGALAREGVVVACMSIAAATNTAVFLAFIEQVLAPALRDRPDAVVVMDNLAAHKADAVRDALSAAGIDHRYLPAYSPDLNPIEPCWSKLKARLRARAVRTLDALEAELGPAPATITSQDAHGWFRLCGYDDAPN